MIKWKKLPRENIGNNYLVIWAIVSVALITIALFVDPTRLGGLTGIAAVIGAVAAILKQIQESNRQRDLDRDQKRTEEFQRLDDEFRSVVTNLGSENDSLKVSSAAAILTFIEPEAEFDFNSEAVNSTIYPNKYLKLAFLTLLGNLRIDHPSAVHRMLVIAFSRAMGEWLKKGNTTRPLDLSDTNLNGIDFTGMTFPAGTDLKNAQLKNAILRDATLKKVRGLGVCFQGAILSDANMHEAWLGGNGKRRVVPNDRNDFTNAYLHNTKLINAQLCDAIFKGANLENVQLNGSTLKYVNFQNANLQAAHLEGAKLEGADFQNADVSRANFKGATIDESCLVSLIKTRKDSWKRATFDAIIQHRLENL